jgi:hypothetical protein
MNSFNRVGRDLHQIHEFFAASSSFTFASIQEDSAGLHIEKYSLWKHLFSPRNSASTKAYFQKVFGERRVERLFATMGRGPWVSKGDIQKLFVSLGELCEADFEDLLALICSSNPRIRYLSETETTTLRRQFQTISKIQECSKEQLNLFYQLLVPFARLEDIFFDHLPDCEIRALDTGERFQGLESRVYMYELFRRGALSYDQRLMLHAKKFPCIAPKPGTVFPGLHGTLVKIHDIVEGSGAYKIFLKTMGSASSEEGNYVLYRCTRLTPTRASLENILDNLCPAPGQRGADATREVTRQHFGSPDFGGKKVTAIGYSLGCCHAAYDMTRGPSSINHAIFVAPLGVDHTLAALFRERVKPMTLDYYLEAHDVVDQLGEQFIGAGCLHDFIKTRVHILTVNNLSGEIAPRVALERIAARRHIFGNERLIIKVLRASGYLFRALMGDHTRLTPFQPYREFVISSDDQGKLVDDILSHSSSITDPQWEELRGGISRLLFGRATSPTQERRINLF